MLRGHGRAGPRPERYALQESQDCDYDCLVGRLLLGNELTEELVVPSQRIGLIALVLSLITADIVNPSEG